MDKKDYLEVDLTSIEAKVDFEGHTVTVTDANKMIGNLMKFEGNVILDIEFEDLAKEIYYEKPGEKIKIKKAYLPYIIQVIKNDNSHKALLRNAIIELLTKE